MFRIYIHLKKTISFDAGVISYLPLGNMLKDEKGLSKVT